MAEECLTVLGEVPLHQDGAEAAVWKQRRCVVIPAKCVVTAPEVRMRENVECALDTRSLGRICAREPRFELTNTPRHAQVSGVAISEAHKTPYKLFDSLSSSSP